MRNWGLIIGGERVKPQNLKKCPVTVSSLLATDDDEEGRSLTMYERATASFYNTALYVESVLGGLIDDELVIAGDESSEGVSLRH